MTDLRGFVLVRKRCCAGTPKRRFPRSPPSVRVEGIRSYCPAATGSGHDAIGILRASGHRNLAAALGRNARDATQLLPLLGVTGP